MNGDSQCTIPTRQQCDTLMARYAMLPNIVAHSYQVMRVALAITDSVKDGLSIHRDKVIAGALLHDITKTRSLETKEHHDASGGALLRELGFLGIAEMVEQHVRLHTLDLDGALNETEIVYYADKRVMHDTIVTLDKRMSDLIVRYGRDEETIRRIVQNKEQVLAVEKKIERFLKTDIHHAIKTGSQSLCLTNAVGNPK